MKNVCSNARFVNPTLWVVLFFCALPWAWAGQIGVYQHGTVIRMRMGDCALSHRGFMANFGGPAAQLAQEVCPEYTLVSDKVVFVIVGRSSDQLVPLADVIDFRFHKNELSVRIDDARRESKFSIKEMILRSEWDMVQHHIQDELGATPQATATSATSADSHMATRRSPAPSP